MVHGRLYVGTINKGENQLIYTVPPEAVSLKLEINIINTSNEVASVKIAVSDKDTPDVADYIDTYVNLFQRKGNYRRSDIFVSAGEKVFISSSAGPIIVRVSGTEI